MESGMDFGAISADNVSGISGIAPTRRIQQYQNQVCTHFFYKIIRQQSCVGLGQIEPQSLLLNYFRI